jgi:Putative DNA-binding domain
LMPIWQNNFARALLDRELPVPEGVIAYNSERPERRFAVYRNNMMVSLLGVLEDRFPATCRIVGEEFFRAAARLFIAAEPPRSPVMMFYGDSFPSYLAKFEPARSVPYLADVARLEAARTRAYHAADAKPLARDAFAAVPLEALAGMRFTLHPSLEIVSSPYPIVTIYAMNSGEMEPAPITDWRGEDALIVRPECEVEVRRISAGARIFLQRVAGNDPLGEAAGAASTAGTGFDLAASLAALFSGLAIGMTSTGTQDGPI